MLLSGVKFFLAPSTVVITGYGFWDTIWITSVGGILGFLMFFYFGQFFRRKMQFLFKKKEKKRFSKRNRFIAKIRGKYGLWGLAILTPCILSIPIGAVMASIYYPKRKGVLMIFGLMIIAWSFILTSITLFIKNA